MKENLQDYYNEAETLRKLCKSKNLLKSYEELDTAFYGCTSGEILTNLGVAVSNILENSSKYDNDVIMQAKKLRKLIHIFI